jgi:glycerol-3-phosphate dehydrogenase
MSDFSAAGRSLNLARMQREELDVLIIGGGITGAGLLLDGAARGLLTGLVDAHDFASGTSSRSTKLIHGGLRYLEHFEFGLVREALHERAVLTRLARHLVEPVPFMIPIYSDQRRNYDNPLKLRAGLYLYDLLSGSRSPGRHKRLSASETRARAPQLSVEGLRGSLLYYDCRTDDARLVIEVLKSAHALGGLAASYAPVEGFNGSGGSGGAGRISGVHVRDQLSGTSLDVRARVVINATGVWMDDVLGLREGAERRKVVRPSKGIHLIVSTDRLRIAEPWLIPASTGHRFYFVVPWEGRVLIGTTDTDYEGDKENPRADAEEVEEILNAINSYFPEARLGEEDVISTIAGLRPLIASDGNHPTASISREEQLFESGDGLISIAGGKLTTYRVMAKKTMDLAVSRLGLNGRQSTTETIGIGGNCSKQELFDIEKQLGQEFGGETASHLVHAYGSGSLRVAAIARENDGLRLRLIDSLPQIFAEVVYAARHEMAMSLADVFVRRLRLGMLAGGESLKSSRAAASWMARELQWDDLESERQVKRYVLEYETQLAPPSRRRG